LLFAGEVLHTSILRRYVVKVAELILRLRCAEPDAVVMMASTLSPLSGLVEVGKVHQPKDRWIRIYRLHEGGAVTNYLCPPNGTPVGGFNPDTDEAAEEQVVILASANSRFEGNGASDG
jgi:hypothetical protein